MADIKPEVLIPPQSSDEFHEDVGRHWPRVLSYLLSAAIVGLAVVFVGRAIYRSINNDSPKPPAVVNTKQTAKQPAAKSPAQNNTDNNSTNSSNTASGQLPNNGPGNIAAVFTVSALAAGGLHYALKRRRDA